MGRAAIIPAMSSIFKQLGWGATIGIVGGVVGALVGLAAVSMAGTGAVVLYLVFCFFFFGVFWKFMFGPMVRANHLEKIGIEAEATVLALAETGSSLQVGGSLPKAGVRLELDVRPADRAPFKGRVTAFISMFEIQKFQPGAVVHVKFDPRNPQEMTLVEGTPTLGRYQTDGRPEAPAARDVAAVQASVEAMAAEDRRITALGVEAPALVRRMTVTEVTVNGDNPLVELTVQVQPADGQTYTAETKAAVVRTSLHKFEPGRIIQVKFDPADRTKVTVLHS